MNKYLIVGDVHGCIEEALQLLETAGALSKTNPRKVISVGDLVDKGPESGEVVDVFYWLKAIVVKGNHENKHEKFHVHELKKKTNPGYKNPMAPAKHPEEFAHFHIAREQLLKLDFDAFEYMASFPLFHRIEEYGVTIVHGGLEPGKSPERSGTSVMYTRTIKPNGQMAQLSESAGLPFWTSLYSGPKKCVVFGHQPFKEPHVVKKTNPTFAAFGIDTGACYGNKLTGLLVPEMELVSVPAKQKYCEINSELHPYFDERPT